MVARINFLLPSAIFVLIKAYLTIPLKKCRVINSVWAGVEVSFDPLLLCEYLTRRFGTEIFSLCLLRVSLVMANEKRRPFWTESISHTDYFPCAVHKPNLSYRNRALFKTMSDYRPFEVLRPNFLTHWKRDTFPLMSGYCPTEVLKPKFNGIVKRYI